jgi:hypothetical protein
MVKHPPGVTVSNMKVQLREGVWALSQPCPKGEDDLGWVQLKKKSLLCQEIIEGSSVITLEGLITLTHSSRMGWTIMSGTWTHPHQWGIRDSNTVYLWDSMEDQDKQNSLEDLRKDEEWVIWKTKDDRWTHELKKGDFHKLLSLDKDTRESSWGHKIRGWWRRGDIKVTKCKKGFHP